jgi:hypothetical protein
MFSEAPLGEMEWLPTSPDGLDPIHGRGLETAAHNLNREVEFKAARLEVFRLALASQRTSADQPVLKVGPTDYNEAARMAGRFSCRMAASEIVVDQVGFWCNIVQLYQKGHWPLGRLPSGDVVVL